MFVNREKEIIRLRSALGRKDAQLIIVYGRRRCGKSALLQMVMQPGDALYFASDKRETTLQIRAFSAMAGQIITGFDQVVYPDWETVLLALDRNAGKYLIKRITNVSGADCDRIN